MSDNATQASTTGVSPNGVRIFAKSVFRELKQSGHQTRDVIAFANELLELVAQDVRGDGPSDAE